jgi:hypothetical protein
MVPQSTVGTWLLEFLLLIDKLFLAVSWIVGTTMMVYSMMLLVLCVFKYKPEYWEHMLLQRPLVAIEEFSIMWFLLGSILVAFGGANPRLGQVLVFVIACLLTGLAQSLVGFFKLRNMWRRLQGMLLMTIAVVCAAGYVLVTYTDSPAGPILMIGGAIMVFTIVMLQMYWWGVFRRFCGDSRFKESPQVCWFRGATCDTLVTSFAL